MSGAITQASQFAPPALEGHCPACGASVPPDFVPSCLVNLPEPHASVLELFLRVRGNAKEVERELGLSYPTVRARLDEAFAAVRLQLDAPSDGQLPPASWRTVILDALEREVLTPAEAVARLHAGLERDGAGESVTTAAERKRVLAIVASGDITTDDADAILGALSAPPSAAAGAGRRAARDPVALAQASTQAGAAGTAPRWRAIVIRVAEGGEPKVNARLPLDLARDADRFLPRQAKHYFARCGIELETLLKKAGRFDRVRGSTAGRWDSLLRRLARLPGDGTLADIEDGDVELSITLE